MKPSGAADALLLSAGAKASARPEARAARLEELGCSAAHCAATAGRLEATAGRIAAPAGRWAIAHDWELDMVRAVPRIVASGVGWGGG